MSALEIQERDLKTIKKQTDLLIVRPSNLLFKVVVNNYRKEPASFEENEEIGETMMGQHHRLPPQPSGYFKFPDYDWF
jgi:hypothetical protein